MKKIVPHFQKYALRTQKKDDFDKFVKVCEFVYQTKHRNWEYLKEIIDIAYSMNISWKRKYKKDELLSVIDKVKI